MAKTYKKMVKWYERKAALNQIFQRGLQFALVSKDGQQVTPFVLCRDFLQDAIQAYLNKTKRSIYGFTYDAATDIPISLDRTRLVIANSDDKDLKTKLPNCLEFLHQIEDQLKLPHTRLRECQNPPKKYARGGVWYLEGSGRWMKSPPMISFYTLMIRVGMLHPLGDPFMQTINNICSGMLKPYQAEDRDRVIGGKDGIKQILEKGDRSIFNKKIEENYPPNIEVGIMHNSCGIVGFSRGSTKSNFPKWHLTVKPPKAKAKPVKAKPVKAKPVKAKPVKARAYWLVISCSSAGSPTAN